MNQLSKAYLTTVRTLSSPELVRVGAVVVRLQRTDFRASVLLLRLQVGRVVARAQRRRRLDARIAGRRRLEEARLQGERPAATLRQRRATINVVSYGACLVVSFRVSRVFVKFPVPQP